MGNGFRIDLDGFSAREIESDSILNNFHLSVFFWCSPAGPNWAVTQVDLGPGRPRPKLTWVLASQDPI